MRVAILSDIHGNIEALDAVLADIDRLGGVDAYWILGDLAALGPSPTQTLQRLTQLPNATFIRGNTDRYVCNGDRPSPSKEQVRDDINLLDACVEVQGSFSWTQGCVTESGWFDWLDALPMEMRHELPDGTSVLCVHASPGTDDGSGIMPDMQPSELVDLLGDADADLVLVGHTHMPLELKVGSVHVFNPGSVTSGPYHREAAYGLLDADETGYKLEHRMCAYDVQTTIAKLERVRHPAVEFLRQKLLCDPDIIFS